MAWRGPRGSGASSPAAVQQAGTKGLVATKQVINLGSVKVTVIPPPPGMNAGDQNLHSLGLLIQYGPFKALMTGDSETAETAGWLKTYPASFLGRIDVYKSIHHGAKNGDNPAWLAAGGPETWSSGWARTTTVIRPRRRCRSTPESTRRCTERISTAPSLPPPAAAQPSAHAEHPRLPQLRGGAGSRQRADPGYIRKLDRDGDGVGCE